MRALFGFCIALVIAGCADDGPVPQKQSTRTLVTLAPAEGGQPGALSVSIDALSIDELRACVADKQRMQTNDAASAEEHAELEKRQAKVGDSQAELQAAKLKLDSRSKVSVDAFNTKIKMTNAAVNRLNADAAAYNGRVAARGQLVNKFNTGCAGHSYYKEDMDVVIKDFPDVDLTK